MLPTAAIRLGVSTPEMYSESRCVPKTASSFLEYCFESNFDTLAGELQKRIERVKEREVMKQSRRNKFRKRSM